MCDDVDYMVQYQLDWFGGVVIVCSSSSQGTFFCQVTFLNSEKGFCIVAELLDKTAQWNSLRVVTQSSYYLYMSNGARRLRIADTTSNC